jgi:hypothetical protein
MRWLRLYDDTINDPKILKLPEAMRWHWIAMLCVASKNEGTLPPLDDIAIQLRMTAAKATEIIAALVKANLLDKTETGFAPHNWNGRQYKSDVSTERVKRFRNGKRNVSSDVSETPPEAEQIQKQSRAEPRAEISSSEKVLRTDLMEAFGPSRTPDLSRAGVWLSKGYAAGMIVEVVRELLARKPDIGNLAYFDSALAERHANQPLSPSERAAVEIDYDKAASLFKKGGPWSKYAGPEPGQIGCKCPPEILAKYGFEIAPLRRMDS